MASQVDICNFALSHISVKNITSLTAASEEARKCNLFWTPALESVLRSHDWNFAGQNQALAIISDETITGYDYLYKYPSNALFIRKIYSDSTDFTKKRTEDYVLCQSPTTKHRAIATNVEDAYASFTVKIADPTLFDSAFVEALSYKLASFLAKPLTGDTALAQAMVGMSDRIINAAKAANKAEQKEDQKRTSKYLSARG